MRKSLIAAGAALCLSLLALQASAQVNTSETYRQLNLFGDVFERVRADYVKEVSDEKLIESAINGMLVSLDPHSSYMTAKSFRDMQVQTRGEFGGLGIEVTMENGLVKVVSPIDDTPAYRAGVKPGDLITHLDGELVQGLSLAEAVERMRGKVNTDIVITVRRDGRDPFDITITRAVIKIRSVRWRTEGDIGYLRITSFSEQTADGVASAMKKIKEKAGAELLGIVLDLRNNPGGLLDQAVKVSDAFLDRGEIVSTRSRQAEDVQRFNATAGDLAKNLPIVVLINGGSASASEIVAGALQDHRRAVIMGTRSFGKGSVQTIIPLARHGAIRLTTAHYYTPSGRSIQAKGIDPDLKVEQAKIESLEPRTRRREGDLRGALKNPNSSETPDKDKKKDAKVPKKDSKAKPDKPEDYQLSRALDLIRGIALFNVRVSN
jgi:carboxyl-terminal processing protease